MKVIELTKGFASLGEKPFVFFNGFAHGALAQKEKLTDQIERRELPKAAEKEKLLAELHEIL